MPGPVAASRIVTGLLSFAEICSRNKRYFCLLKNISDREGGPLEFTNKQARHNRELRRKLSAESQG